MRQHPETGKGVTFVTLEEETGQVNIIVWRAVAQRQTRVLIDSVLLGIDGVFQSAYGAQHPVAHRLYDVSHPLPEVAFALRDVH